MGDALNIIFMGSPDFAVPHLEKLAASRHSIVAVVTGPDKKRGRGSGLSPTPVKKSAQQLHVPVLEYDSMKNPELSEILKTYQADLFVVVAFKLLPDQLLSIPKLGCINVHASLLPKFRGAAPIHHAVMQGEKQTGCTIFKLDSGMDTGGIIAKKSLSIGPDETTGSVYSRLMQLGSEMLPEAVEALATGTATFTPQDTTKATAAPKIFDEHCVLNFRKPAVDVHNHIRGLSPFPGAYAMLESKKMKIISSHYDKNAAMATHTGKITIEDTTVYVDCGDIMLAISELQYQGKKAMPAIDFMRGYQGKMIFDGY